MTTPQKIATGGAALAALATALLVTVSPPPAAPVPVVDPPEIPLELTMTGSRVRFQQSTSPAGPWTTVFERPNEHLEPKIRFTMYATSACMFYRGEVVP